MLRKATVVPDVWEARRLERFVKELNAASLDSRAFPEVLERLVFFLIDPKTKNALSDNNFEYVKEVCRDHIIPLVSAFELRFAYSAHVFSQITKIAKVYDILN